MRYVIIVWLVVFGLLFLLTGQSKADAPESLRLHSTRDIQTEYAFSQEDPKWDEYLKCIGGHYIMYDPGPSKSPKTVWPPKDMAERYGHFEAIRNAAIISCKKYIDLPKRK